MDRGHTAAANLNRMRGSNGPNQFACRLECHARRRNRLLAQEPADQAVVVRSAWGRGVVTVMTSRPMVVVVLVLTTGQRVLATI